MQKKEQVIPITAAELIEQVENYQKALNTAQEDKTKLETLNQNLKRENIDLEEKTDTSREIENLVRKIEEEKPKLDTSRENLARNVENINQHIQSEIGSPQTPLGRFNSYLKGDAKDQNPKVILMGVNRFLTSINDDKENKIIDRINAVHMKHQQQPQYQQPQYQQPQYQQPQQPQQPQYQQPQYQKYEKQTIIIPNIAKAGILPRIMAETTFTTSNANYDQTQGFCKAGKYEALSTFMKYLKNELKSDPLQISIKVTVITLEVSQKDADKLQNLLKEGNNQDLQKFITELTDKAQHNNKAIEKAGVILDEGMKKGYVQAAQSTNGQQQNTPLTRSSQH